MYLKEAKAEARRMADYDGQTWLVVFFPDLTWSDHGAFHTILESHVDSGVAPINRNDIVHVAEPSNNRMKGGAA